MTVTRDFLHHLLQREGENVLVRLGLLHAVARGGRALLPRGSKYVAVGVGDGYVLGRQTFDGRRDEMDDGVDLSSRQATHPGCSYQHRCGRLGCVAGEQVLLRDNQVNRRRVYTINSPNGLGEFTFQRSLIINVLAEFAGGQSLLVEERIAGSTVTWNSFCRKIDSGAIHQIVGNQNRGTAAAELIRNTLGVEARGDRRRVGRRQVAVQRGVPGLTRPSGKHERSQNHGCPGQTQHGLLATRETVEGSPHLLRR